MHIQISKVNESYIKVIADLVIEKEINGYFTLKAPGYKFSQAYKNRTWNGDISLYNIRTKLLPIGLYSRLKQYCDDNSIDIEFRECDRYSCVNEKNDIDIQDVSQFVNDLNLYSRNVPITARDYQLSAIHKAIVDRRVTLISPTSCLDPEEELELVINDSIQMIKLKDIGDILDSGVFPYINSSTGLVKIIDHYKKYGVGFNLVFDDNTSFKCAERHKIFNGVDFVDAIAMQVGDIFSTKTLIKKEPVPYQEWIDFSVDADHESYIHKGITHHNSGKSLIIYCLIRYILEEDPDARVLLVVPNVQLVNQMFGDFRDYSSQNGWNIDEHCQKLYSGQSKELFKRVLITTWQSFSKISKDRVNGPKILSLYRGVIADECHLASGKEFQSILEKCGNASYRIGTTGTIDTSPDAKLNTLQIEGFLGPIHRVITTKELIDTKQVSNLLIKALVLKYSDEDKELIKGADYQQEIDWLIENNNRNAFIMKVAVSTDGTTLLLVKKRDAHAKKLYEALKKVSKRPVYYISGSVGAEEREQIRQIANIENCIIVATMATMSTGVSIPNIRHVIFGIPNKSAIPVLQSIGRGLRLKEGKDGMILWDIIDDIRHKSKSNFSYLHGIERLSIYKKEKFEIKVREIPFQKKD